MKITDPITKNFRFTGIGRSRESKAPYAPFKIVIPARDVHTAIEIFYNYYEVLNLDTPREE